MQLLEKFTPTVRWIWQCEVTLAFENPLFVPLLLNRDGMVPSDFGFLMIKPALRMVLSKLRRMVDRQFLYFLDLFSPLYLLFFSLIEPATRSSFKAWF